MGTITLPNISAQGWVYFDFAFNKTFSSTPNVFIQSNGLDLDHIRVSSRTASNFRLAIYRASGSGTFTYYLSWFAVAGI